MTHSAPVRFVLICLVFVLWSTTHCLGQSISQKRAEHQRRMEQSRREIERARREMQQRMPQNKRQSHSKPSFGSTSNQRPSTTATNQGSATAQLTEPSYVFQSGQYLAYSVQMTCEDKHKVQRWDGVVMLRTDEATPLRDDGSPYGQARVGVWGRVEASQRYFEDKSWHPLSDQNLGFPESTSFSTHGSKDYKKAPAGRTRLPANMSLRVGLLDGLFPQVPSARSEPRRQEKRSYLLQTMYGNTGRGSHDQIKGTATIEQRVTTTSFSQSEHYSGTTSDQSQTLNYKFTRSASFNTAGTLLQSETTYETDWETPTKVTIRVVAMPLQQAISQLSATP